MNTKRKSIWIILIALLIAIVYIIYVFNKPRPNVENEVVDFSLSSYQLTEDFNLDEKGSAKLVCFIPFLKSSKKVVFLFFVKSMN